MGCRRTKRRKPSVETSCSYKSKSRRLVAADVEPESDLPIELLESILSQLSLRDNIRASSVCRRWLAVALSVRKTNRHPWLMYLPKSGDLYEFYDPADRKSYCLELPLLQNSRICYSKDGWLLLYKPADQRFFFYCPYTNKSIDLPRRQSYFEVSAFSASPTSPDCIVFSMRQQGLNTIFIATCRPGDTEWMTANYNTMEPLVGSILNQVVFYNGVFCCLSQSGFVGFYNVKRRMWAVLHLPQPIGNIDRAQFVAAYNDDIYLVSTCLVSQPVVYKVNKANCNLDVIEDLGTMTIFANTVNSCVVSDLVGRMRNGVYFSKVQYYGKRCIMYSMRERRYYPRKEGYDWGKQVESYNWRKQVENVWIDAPGDLSIFS